MSRVFRYHNPIYSDAIDSIRDCHITQVEGRYYMVGTSPPYWQGPNPGVKLYVSDDLLNWRFERLLLDREAFDENVWFRDRFWAPEIHVKAGRYYLTFNCRNDKLRFPHSCGLAVADNILGPYTVVTYSRPLIERGNDLTLFTDDDGQSYAYWNSEHIHVQEIDLEACELRGRPVDCLLRSFGTWDEIGIEGAFVIKRDGIYYMFYSSWTRGYEIGYATAPHPKGPWTKYAGNPIMGAQDPDIQRVRQYQIEADPDNPLVGVGHNAIFTGPDGRDWLVCHFQERGKPEALGFDPIWIENGVIRSDGPTWTEQVISLPDAEA